MPPRRLLTTLRHAARHELTLLVLLASLAALLWTFAEIPADWLNGRTEVIPRDGTVNIQYIPGALERSRLIGHNSRWLVWPFLGCVAVVAFFGVRFWIDFKDHERRSNAASALYKR